MELSVENNYLFDKNDFDIKCSNYADLAAYFKQRSDYWDLQSSTKHINESLFKFQGSIKKILRSHVQLVWNKK